MPQSRPRCKKVLSMPNSTSPSGSPAVRQAWATSTPASPEASCSTLMPVDSVKASRVSGDTLNESWVSSVTVVPERSSPSATVSSARWALSGASLPAASSEPLVTAGSSGVSAISPSPGPVSSPDVPSVSVLATDAPSDCAPSVGSPMSVPLQAPASRDEGPQPRRVRRRRWTLAGSRSCVPARWSGSKLENVCDAWGFLRWHYPDQVDGSTPLQSRGCPLSPAAPSSPVGCHQ